MKRIGLIGSRDYKDSEASMHEYDGIPGEIGFLEHIGAAVIKRDCVLVTGGYAGVGEIASVGAYKYLKNMGLSDEDIKKRIINLLRNKPISALESIVSQGRYYDELREAA